MSTLKVQNKVLISVACGILAFLFCPYGLQVQMGDTSIDILWSTFFPVIAAMALGWRYGLLSGIAGGVFFPFFLWPEDGWANVSTAAEYLLLYAALGATKSEAFLKFIPRRIAKVALVLLVYNLINFSYDLFGFNPMLSLNPAFWNPDSITSLPPDLILSFGVKDGINVITLVLASETLLRLPLVRTIFGLRTEAKMEGNYRIFFISILIPFFIWFAFIILGHLLLKDTKALQYEHKSFALFVIITNGLLVCRMLFYYNENRILIQMKLNESNEKLRRQNKELEQFVYITSHDLQEPLQTIMSVSRLMQEEYMPHSDNLKKYINFIEESSLRLHTLIKGLMEYSRIGQETKLSDVDCNILLQKIIKGQLALIIKHPVTIEYNNLPVVQAYARELPLLFYNLIVNAVKFSRTGVPPVIHIACIKEAGSFHFTVQDNGIGIDAKYKEKIFLLFQRLHNRKEYEGVGIGLALCKKIVDVLGGRIWFESEPAIGTTFHFTIPIIKPDES